MSNYFSTKQKRFSGKNRKFADGMIKFDVMRKIWQMNFGNIKMQ